MPSRSLMANANVSVSEARCDNAQVATGSTSRSSCYAGSYVTCNETNEAGVEIGFEQEACESKVFAAVRTEGNWVECSAAVAFCGTI